MNFIKKFVKKCFQTVGLHVTLYNVKNSEDLLLNHILKKFGIKTIIDVGANEGQYASAIFENGFTGSVYSFEPISQPFSVLGKKAAGNPRWHVFNLGVGQKEEELTINVSENIVSSSIFEVGGDSLSAEPATRIVRQEKIKLTSIDSFLATQSSPLKEILLKLDVQGFELEALKGAQARLRNFKFIQAELSFVPVYKNAPLFGEINSFLEKNGFEIFTIIPGFRDMDSGRMLQADGIFIRKDH